MSTLKIIRYLFIATLYNLIISLITYIALTIGTYYHFEYSEWSFIQWWLYFSILIVFIVIGAYLAPFYDECLETLLERILTKVKVAKKTDKENVRKRIKELEDWYKELTEDDEK